MEKENVFKWKHYRFWCKKSLKLGHTDITTLKKVCDQYGKGEFVQMETLSA